MRIPRVLALDIGGTKMAAAIVDADGRVAARDRIATSPSADAERLFANLAEMCEALLEAAPVAAIGSGCGGPMRYPSGVVSPLNIHAWRDFPLRERLARRFGLPTIVDNDAKALALGERWLGAGRGSDNMLGMVVSTGVGGGFILDGQLRHGHSGNAGHVGHIVVWPNGPRCGCGGCGCLEAVASGSGLARRLATALASRPSDRPASHTSDRPASQASDRPVDEPRDRSASQTTERQASHTSDRPASQPGDRSATEASDRPADEPRDRPASQTTERQASHSSNGPASQASDRPASEAGDDAMRAARHDPPGPTRAASPGHTSAASRHHISDDWPGEASDTSRDHISDASPFQTSDAPTTPRHRASDSRGARADALDPLWLAAHPDALAATRLHSGATAAEIATAARQGDLLAAELLRSAGEGVGRGIASAAALLDLELVVIGGSIALKSWDLLAPPLFDELARSARLDFTRDVRVVQAALGDDAGLLGAARLAFDHLMRREDVSDT